jgi:hypothetical protein
MVDFKNTLKRAIRETSEAGREFKGLRVLEFKLIESRAIKNLYGLEGEEYKFLVMCEHNTKEDDNKVFFDVYLNTINGELVAFYEGSEEYYKAHHK